MHRGYFVGIGNDYAAPSNLAHVPHAVLHDRQLITLSGTAVFGAWAPVGGVDTIAPLLGNMGTSGVAPFAATTTNIIPTNITTTVLARCRLARLRVRIVCLPPASAALLPGGYVNVLCIPQNVEAAAYATYGDLKTFVRGHGKTKTFSSYRLMHGLDIPLMPNDLTENRRLNQLGGTNAVGTPFVPMDSWGAIVISPEDVPAGTTFTLVIHSTWSVEYTRDLVMAQLNTKHPITSDSVMARAAEYAQDHWETIADVLASGTATALYGPEAGMLVHEGLQAVGVQLAAKPRRARRARPPAPRRRRAAPARRQAPRPQRRQPRRPRRGRR